MPEVLPTSQVNRWYTLRFRGSLQPKHLFAERHFDSEDAIDYWQQRVLELGDDRVWRPIPSHENSAVWAACIDPK
jgi:hypothetical protein